MVALEIGGCRRREAASMSGRRNSKITFSKGFIEGCFELVRIWLHGTIRYVPLKSVSKWWSSLHGLELP